MSNYFIVPAAQFENPIPKRHVFRTVPRNIFFLIFPLNVLEEIWRTVRADAFRHEKKTSLLVGIGKIVGAEVANYGITYVYHFYNLS